MKTKEDNSIFYVYLFLGVIVALMIETINLIEESIYGIGLIAYCSVMCLYYLIQINEEQKSLD